MAISLMRWVRYELVQIYEIKTPAQIKICTGINLLNNHEKK
jgi:hypothetical protein